MNIKTCYDLIDIYCVCVYLYIKIHNTKNNVFNIFVLNTLFFMLGISRTHFSQFLQIQWLKCSIQCCSLCCLTHTQTLSVNCALLYSLSTLTRAGLTGLPYDLCHLLPKLRVLWVSQHKYAPATHKRIGKLISERFLKIQARGASSNSPSGIWSNQTPGVPESMNLKPQKADTALQKLYSLFIW